MGSSVHIAATESMESSTAIKTGRSVALSIQNLIDCTDPSMQSLGADFEYVLQNGGIDTEASYPSTGTRGPCKYTPAGKGASFTVVYNVSGGDESTLTNLVWKYGPVAVTVDATSWEFYNGGVDSAPCGTPDHAALVVGYTGDYWIVQNSWGTDWGINGYIYIARNRNNASCIAYSGLVAV
uniref:Peptidase C1A papain C-terminal domain-containing protein n=1 Tax=Arcella intermedia TaxID=1963864 RepID=A0A6B2LJC7_9EUKA|eukprot:TRINITY_DN5963_c0_g1_i2.p1 TRINITY_DN5963_c0_g1~~TRINITY_DN5963_c0_g1_i2.p1  ORF type:complete len:181 (-),score=15.15 TRINITY_DN5963_c0_g1_i2:43-585(-)